MRVLTRLLQAALFAAVVAQPACAAEKKADSEALIRSALVRQFPKHKVGDIRKSPLPGIYEVTVGNEVVYSDAQAKYVFFGDLVDLTSKKSLTEARKNEMMKGAFAELPLDAAIKAVRGNGRRQVAVFTDPDCPYCRQLDNVGLKNITNVTIYYFLLPLDQLHPDARRKSANIWCAPDRARAWFDLMYEGKEAPDAKCEVPFDIVAAQAAKLGFSGTPGLLFADGTRVPGAVDAEKIEQLLDAATPKK